MSPDEKVWLAQFDKKAAELQEIVASNATRHPVVLEMVSENLKHTKRLVHNFYGVADHKISQ